MSCDHDHAIVDPAGTDDGGEVRVDLRLNRGDLLRHAAGVVDGDDDVDRPLRERGRGVQRRTRRGVGVAAAAAAVRLVAVRDVVELAAVARTGLFARFGGAAAAPELGVSATARDHQNRGRDEREPTNRAEPRTKSHSSTLGLFRVSMDEYRLQLFSFGEGITAQVSGPRMVSQARPVAENSRDIRRLTASLVGFVEREHWPPVRPGQALQLAVRIHGRRVTDDAEHRDVRVAVRVREQSSRSCPCSRACSRMSRAFSGPATTGRRRRPVA